MNLAVTYWWSPNDVQHAIRGDRCVTCGRTHEPYVTPGHPVRAGAGYDCACGECLAVRGGAAPAKKAACVLCGEITPATQRGSRLCLGCACAESIGQRPRLV